MKYGSLGLIIEIKMIIAQIRRELNCILGFSIYKHEFEFEKKIPQYNLKLRYI